MSCTGLWEQTRVNLARKFEEALQTATYTKGILSPMLIFLSKFSTYTTSSLSNTENQQEHICGIKQLELRTCSINTAHVSWFLLVARRFLCCLVWGTRGFFEGTSSCPAHGLNASFPVEWLRATSSSLALPKQNLARAPWCLITLNNRAVKPARGSPSKDTLGSNSNTKVNAAFIFTWDLLEFFRIFSNAWVSANKGQKPQFSHSHKTNFCFIRGQKFSYQVQTTCVNQSSEDQSSNSHQTRTLH